MPPPQTAALKTVSPAARSRTVSEATLRSLVDDATEESLRAVLDLLRDPDTAGYVKVQIAKMFVVPAVRQLGGADADSGNESVRLRFLALMAEMRDVPKLEPVVTETSIDAVAVDQVPTFG